MQAKKNGNGHYNADESRALLRMIRLYEDMEYVLKSTPLAFRLDEKYVEMLKLCNGFYKKVVEVQIPNDLPEFKVVEYDPIFYMSEMIQVSSVTKDYNFTLKMIGEDHMQKFLNIRMNFIINILC